MALDVLHSVTCEGLEQQGDLKSCLCRLTAFMASLGGALKSLGFEAAEAERLLEELTTAWLSIAKPAYVPEAAYKASLKSGWLQEVVELMGEEGLEELLEIVLDARECCGAYEAFLREALIVVAEAMRFERDSLEFVYTIAREGSCEEVRSVLALALALKPSKVGGYGG